MNATVTNAGLLLPDGRAVPWAEVYRLDWTARGAWLACSAGLLKLDRAIAEAAEGPVAPWELERDAWWTALTDEERAALLGLAPGERVSVSARNDPMRMLVALLLWPVAMIAATPGVLLARWLGWRALAAAAWVCGGGVALRVATWALHALGAEFDADGLTLRTRLAWTDLRALPGHLRHNPFRSAPGVYRLATRYGPRAFGLNSPAAQRLQASVAAVLAGRAEAVPQPAEEGLFARACVGRRALLVNEHGVTEFSRRGSRLTVWSAVPPVQWLASGPRWGGQHLSGYHGGRELALALDSRRADAPAPPLAVPGEQIEAWLGLEPGGVLRCQPSWRRKLVLPLFLGGLALVVASVGPLVAFVAFWFGLWRLSPRLGRMPTILADAGGLSIRQGGRVDRLAWDEVQGVVTQRGATRLWLPRGWCDLDHGVSGVERLVSALHRLLAAREHGALLPRERPVPAAALSRLGPPELDRGLSITQEPPR